MRAGMLWFDDSPDRTLAQKIEKAAAHYWAKYSRDPNVCYVHPLALGTATSTTIAGIEVKGSKLILPHHFWLGRDEEKVTK